MVPGSLRLRPRGRQSPDCRIIHHWRESWRSALVSREFSRFETRFGLMPVHQRTHQSNHSIIFESTNKLFSQISHTKNVNNNQNKIHLIESALSYRTPNSSSFATRMPRRRVCNARNKSQPRLGVDSVCVAVGASLIVGRSKS